MISTAGGLLLVDKPAGPTSHDVVDRVRRVTGTRRVGHTGTLDPLATGLLILCLGRATRLAEFLAGRPKSYQAVIRLGLETTTYDAEGEAAVGPGLATDVESIRPVQLEEALASFRGPIRQRPPIYSAVKVDGQPLYKRARRGLEAPRPEREVTVYSLELLSWKPPDATIQLACSSGTYVRSIAHDLGRLLGCGGHLASLRRLAIGPLSVDEAVPLEDLDPQSWSAHLRPPDLAVEHLARVELTAGDALRLSQGQPVPRPVSDAGSPELARAYSEGGTFIGLISAAGEYWRPRKILWNPD